MSPDVLELGSTLAPILGIALAVVLVVGYNRSVDKANQRQAELRAERDRKRMDRRLADDLRRLEEESETRRRDMDQELAMIEREFDRDRKRRSAR